jgi:uncharacterized RDD family membrane protein YckC
MERESTPVSPHSAASEDIAPLVQRLLGAYQEALSLVPRGTGPFLLLPHALGAFGSVRTPRLRTLVPAFIAVHAGRSTRQLKRQLHAAAVAAGEPRLYEREVALLDRFESSLASVPTRTLLVLLVPGMLALSYWTAVALGAHHDDVRPLGDLIGAVFSLSRHDGIEAIKSYGWRAQPIYFTALGLTVALWLLLLLPMTSFRLKRGLFNVCPGCGGRLEDVARVDTRSANGGIYALERELFERLGARAPVELRFDLALEGALSILAAAAGVYFAIEVIHYPNGPGFLAMDVVHPHDRTGYQFVATALLIALSLSRLRLVFSARRGPRPVVAPRAPERLPASLPAAPWSRRAGAWLIDGFAIYLLLIPVAGLSVGIGSVAGDAVANVVVYGSLPFLPPLYVALSLRQGGAGYGTPGKRAMKLRVVEADGSTPSLKRLLVREVAFKWIVFSPIFAGLIYPVVNYLRPLWNERRATFYDDWLKLRVVRLVPEEAPAETSLATLLPAPP